MTGSTAGKQQLPGQGHREEGPALAEAMAHHEGWMRAVAYSVLGRIDEVDDVLQEVWLAVWQRRFELSEVKNLRNWLYTLTRNISVDTGRRKHRRKALWKKLTDLFRPERQAADSPERRLVSRQEHQNVLAAIQSLDERHRTVLMLRVRQELSYREIAETLDIPVDTVGTRLVRARRRLKRKLEQRHKS